MGLRRLCGIAGPAAFVAAWVTGGLWRRDYAPARDAISRLAEQGASTAPLMTSGFVAYGVLLPVFATTLPRPAGVAVALSGLGTLGVAACPVTPESGQLVDKLHAGAAVVAYAANVAAPVLLSRSPRSVAVSSAIAACLVTSIAVPRRTGLFQRVGLTLFDAWAVVTAVRR